ncbi:GGDEF domain-containing protein [Shewanella psychrotolerans]|uniref:GGDEF domain-containing protein n=1 Tax=Shewanella psychrotolerans TaxID=2864206 RepID=UPI001C659D57|nr:GGDEF domain-containing protein [Shewanella psychrotolerans]QYK00399.1 GGDEF domain-containing protein [Shewanella psychrotolerans]
MLKNISNSFLIAMALAGSLSAYYLFTAITSNDFLLKKSNKRIASIFENIVENTQLKNLVIEIMIENGGHSGKLTFMNLVENLANTKGFNSFNYEYKETYLDEYIADSGNMFVRHTLTNINKESHNTTTVQSKWCWVKTDCKSKIYTPQKTSKLDIEYQKSGVLKITTPIMKNNDFIGKLTIKLDMKDSEIYKTHNISTTTRVDLNNSLTIINLIDKNALFGDRFSYAKTYFVSENIIMVINTPYTILLLENKNEIAAFFVITFILSLITLTLLHERKYNIELQDKTYKDPLTKLYNRLYFDSNDFLTNNNNHLKDGGKISLITIDGNKIKSINDQYGHLVGDAAIKHISTAIKSCIRDSDVAVRTGGDEFVIVAHCDKNAAKELSNRIKSSVKSRKLSLMNITITISAGYTELAEDESLDNAINRADKLLYIDKSNSKDSSYELADTM